MLIFRYLSKEIFITLASLTTILLLIFMSNQLVRYLNRAAAGQIPFMIIMKLMMLELPNLLGLLMPLGFYVALLLAYGRLYAENEMTVLHSCGYSSQQLFKHSFIIASGVAVIVGIIVFWVSPMIAQERNKLLRSTGFQTIIQTIMPGRFQAIEQGTVVFYVESTNLDHSKAENIFVARRNLKNPQQLWEILLAEDAFVVNDHENLEDYVVLLKGRQYTGIPGNADYRIAEFSQYKHRLPHSQIMVKNDLRTIETKNLWPFFNSDIKKAAELQWRLSVPLMVFTLTLIALPLSRVNPRRGKYAKLLPAIIIYIIYANFMFIMRDWLAEGKLPIWFGMGGLHLIMIIFALLLIWRNFKKFAL